MSEHEHKKNSKAFKKLVRAWMLKNPGWSYQAAAQHIRQLPMPVRTPKEKP